MNLLNIKIVMLLLSFGTIALSGKIAHPLHVSTAEVKCNERDKSLEVSCKIYTDDFETILAKGYKQKVDLTNASLKSAMDGLVKKYLLSHFQLKANGKALSLNYIGFEIDHETTYIFFEAERIPQIKAIEVNNTILHDLFDDQMSIVHVLCGQNRKSGQVLYPASRFTATF